jgi:citrate lyase beta subunit
MLESYFFIPANREDFFKKIPSISANYFVIDLEDSVSKSEWDKCVYNLKKYSVLSSQYVRPNLWDNGEFTTDQLEKLVEIGVENVVLPKVNTLEQLERIVELKKFTKLILLVETPDLLLALPNVVSKYEASLEAIGFGSQDFAMFTGMKQSTEYMNYARFQINLVASKFGKKCIDTASMLIDDEDGFEEECINAHSMGYSGKFIIHPRQLRVLKDAEYYSQNEIEWAKKALIQINGRTHDEIKAYKVNGMVFEKPHLAKLEKIKQYLESR